MTKKERVISAINGKDVDYVPSGFSLHFDKKIVFGDNEVKAHIDFFDKTDTDIVKIMNENLVPYMGEINSADDYKMVKAVTLEDDFMKNQIELSKRILEKCDTNNSFTMATLHGVTASAIHPLERMSKKFTYDEVRIHLCKLLNENPKPVLDGMKRITEGMCKLATKYIELGIDSVYYAALGGERRFFTDEQFSEWIEPMDKQILSAIKDAGGYAFLHICKDGLDMNRYSGYSDYFDVVNWGVYETQYSLEQGRELFPNKTIMGGLRNRSGVLVDGTNDEVKEEVKNIITSYGKKGFILGADCTLATEQDLGKIYAAVEATRSI